MLVHAGKVQRKDGVITLRGAEQKTVMAWGFRRALPIKHLCPNMTAQQSAVAIESITIAHGFFSWLGQPAGAISGRISVGLF